MDAPARIWSLEAIPTERGVDLVVTVLGWQVFGVRISLDRAEARAFARSILAAAGDAMERTYREASVDAGRR